MALRLGAAAPVEYDRGRLASLSPPAVAPDVRRDAVRSRRRIRHAGLDQAGAGAGRHSSAMTAAAGSNQRLKAIAGPRLTVVGRCLLRGLPVPRWGNLRRVRPFSASYGFDRGTPIDRYYLDTFLRANQTS